MVIAQGTNQTKARTRFETAKREFTEETGFPIDGDFRAARASESNPAVK